MASACHDDLAGADGLDDFALAEHDGDGVELAGGSGEHGDHGAWAHVDGFSCEVFDDLEGGIALVVASEDLHEKHLADHGIGGGVLETVNDVDELVDLFDDLVKTVGVARNIDGHSRESAGAAFGDHKRVDVIRAS